MTKDGTIEVAGLLPGRYRAQAVESALDCVAIARKDHPDMIIMDIMMPGMDGATAAGLMQDVPEIEGVPPGLLMRRTSILLAIWLSGPTM